jgi:hypothetical protein
MISEQTRQKGYRRGREAKNERFESPGRKHTVKRGEEASEVKTGWPGKHRKAQ